MDTKSPGNDTWSLLLWLHLHTDARWKTSWTCWWQMAIRAFYFRGISSNNNDSPSGTYGGSGNCFPESSNGDITRECFNKFILMLKICFRSVTLLFLFILLFCLFNILSLNLCFRPIKTDSQFLNWLWLLFRNLALHRFCIQFVYL